MGRFSGVKKGKLPCVLSKEQLIRCLHNTRDARMAMVIFMGVFQGMRIGEILGLKWGDVDLEKGIILIKDAKDTKRYLSGYGKDRYIPINNKFIRVWKLWQHYNKDKKYVIPSRFPKRKRTVKSMTRTFQAKFSNVLKRSDLVIVDYLQKDGRPRYKYHLHTLRHVCGCNLRRMGIPLEDIQEFLGHSDLETTMVYAKLTKDELKDVIERGYDSRLPTSKVMPPVQLAMDKEALQLQKDILDRQLIIKRMEVEAYVSQ